MLVGSSGLPLAGVLGLSFAGVLGLSLTGVQGLSLAGVLVVLGFLLAGELVSLSDPVRILSEHLV